MNITENVNFNLIDKYKKRIEIPCPECNSKDWDVGNTIYYLINAELAGLIMSIFPILNTHLLKDPISGTIDVSCSGVILYECKNCKYVKIYTADNTVEDLNKGLEKIEKVGKVKLTKFTKNQNS